MQNPPLKTADIPHLIAELRAHIVRKTGKPIDADVDFLTTQIEVLSACGPTPMRMGFEYELSEKQSGIVSHLARRPGMAFTRAAIMNALYFDRPDQPDPKLLDVMVCKIREKLRRHDAPYWLEAVWGIGFRFVHVRAQEGKKYDTKGTKRT